MKIKKTTIVPNTSSKARSFLNFHLGKKGMQGFKGMMFAILLVIAIFGASFFFSNNITQEKRAEPKTEDLVEPSELSIDELKLCSEVDSNYGCIEKNEFNKGEEGFVVVKISGFGTKEETGRYGVNLFGDIKVEKDGKLISELSSYGVMGANQVLNERLDKLFFRNKFKVNGRFELGQYFINVAFYDMIKNSTVSREVILTIK